MKVIIRLLCPISIFISIWGILVYEFNVLAITKYTCFKGWPNTALSISYSIISGWIIYGITVTIPFQWEKYKRQKIVKEQLTLLNEELSYFIESANIIDSNIQYKQVCSKHNKRIISANSFAHILHKIPWRENFPPYAKTYFEQAEAFIRKLINRISEISYQDWQYLTEDQKNCFDMIISLIMRENWDTRSLDPTKQDIESLSQIITAIAFRLQKSMGNDLKIIPN